MTDNQAGSYDYGTFSQNEDELARLSRQATIALAFEEAILGRAGLKKGNDVLDLACGPGVISVALAKIVAPGKVTGLDISDKLIKVANDLKAKHQIDNVDFITGSVYELDLPHDTFDFVYARLLFQHLEEPVRAMKAILPTLKPGGILCITDVDDDWISMYPGSDEFVSFKERAARGQTTRGGDRHVGRKLSTYLNDAGYVDVRTEVSTITTNDLPPEEFLNITTSFKLEQVPEDEKDAARAERDSIYHAIRQPGSWAGVGVFSATGRRG